MVSGEFQVLRFLRGLKRRVVTAALWLMVFGAPQVMHLTHRLKRMALTLSEKPGPPDTGSSSLGASSC